MSAVRPGLRVETGPLISEMDFAPLEMRISTDRYTSPAYHLKERERLWKRIWQVCGRVEELPQMGDWKVHRIFHEAYVIVRGKDDRIRGFVNACRHRGNAFCQGSGNSARFTCPYHNWSYGLDGRLLAVARPDFDGTIEEFVGNKEELGLLQVPVDCFGGFIFMNPDPRARPLSDFLGETAEMLAPYRMEEMVPVGLNVREAVGCNWKVVMDAFQEGYHIQGVHPELVAAVDEASERYSFFGDHSIATAPFGAASAAADDFDAQAEAIRGLPATFPSVTEMLPRFEELVAEHGDKGVSPRRLLQQASREVLTGKGLDVEGLTDSQLSDNHFYLIFPNLFITVRAGEATVIIALPHRDGDPNRCFWHVMSLQWLPPEERGVRAEPLREIAEGDHFPYFLALEQDFEQMQRQQDGLRNSALTHLALTKQEVRLAHFHMVLDAWLEQRPGNATGER